MGYMPGGLRLNAGKNIVKKYYLNGVNKKAEVVPQLAAISLHGI
jgi:hypothetical protein